MSVDSILAKIGLTRDQVVGLSRRYGRKTPEPEPFEEGDDLVEAINDNRPGYLTDKAAGVDAAYHGSLMDD